MVARASKPAERPADEADDTRAMMGRLGALEGALEREERGDDPVPASPAPDEGGPAEEEEVRRDRFAYDPNVPFAINGPLGEIGVVYPTIEQRLLIEREIARIMGGLVLSQYATELAIMLGHLIVLTTQGVGYKPAGLRWTKVREPGDLKYYYDRWFAYDRSFRPGDSETY